jgi:hypothetical protein
MFGLIYFKAVYKAVGARLFFWHPRLNPSLEEQETCSIGRFPERRYRLAGPSTRDCVECWMGENSLLANEMCLS